jgi:hypothetical protein
MATVFERVLEKPPVIHVCRLVGGAEAEVL